MVEFEPVNALEARMLVALNADDQDTYLRLLANAELILPQPDDAAAGWATVIADGVTFLAGYTSPTAMAVSTAGQFTRGDPIRLPDLVATWPDPSWSLVVDPGLPLAAHLPASLLRQLVAGEFGGLPVPGDPATAIDPDPGSDSGPGSEPGFESESGFEPDPGSGSDSGPEFGATEPAPSPPGSPPYRPATGYDDASTQVLPRIGGEHDELVPTVMQKLIPPDQVGFYLDKGYDWVAGYVHRWQDAAKLTAAPDILAGLGHGTPPATGPRDAYLLRWTAYRAELYQAVAEGGAAGVPEYWVNSIRLPHQAEIWRITESGAHHFVAVYDADEQRWLVNRELVGER